MGSSSKDVLNDLLSDSAEDSDFCSLMAELTILKHLNRNRNGHQNVLELIGASTQGTTLYLCTKEIM